MDSLLQSTHSIRVRHFMLLAGQEIPDKPKMPDEKTRWLRARLILEEAFETVEALGFKLSTLTRLDHQHKDFFDYGNGLIFKKCDPNLIEIIDGCCDVKVVTTGTLIACGIPDEPFQREVDENNLAKFGPGGYRNEHGKWMKPPGHKPPDIAGLLKKIGGEA